MTLAKQISAVTQPSEAYDSSFDVSWRVIKCNIAVFSIIAPKNAGRRHEKGTLEQHLDDHRARHMRPTPIWTKTHARRLGRFSVLLMICNRNLFRNGMKTLSLRRTPWGQRPSQWGTPTRVHAKAREKNKYAVHAFEASFIQMHLQSTFVMLNLTSRHKNTTCWQQTS